MTTGGHSSGDGPGPGPIRCMAMKVAGLPGIPMVKKSLNRAKFTSQNSIFGKIFAELSFAKEFSEPRQFFFTKKIQILL